MAEVSSSPGAPTPAGDAAAPAVVDLGDPAAADVTLTGGKAAALARAAAAGLPTVGGVVLTTAFCRAVDAGADPATDPAAAAALGEAFRGAGGDRGPVVARSSSVVEDTAGSSMAGQFSSVLGITDPEGLGAAVREVLGSRDRAGAPGTPMAVLVQPLVEPVFAGVMFGVDPVSGRSDRRVVSAVAGSPEPLVSGEVQGSRWVLDPRGRVVEHRRNDGPGLPRSLLGRLAALADRAAAVFGGPQDIEWAVDGDDRLWLLQSRPVTTPVRGVPTGPVYGPGPVAETFPDPLSELEADLWVPPLRDALRSALVLAGVARRAEVEATDMVIVVGGRVAMDLRFAGTVPTRSGLLARLNPVPAARRLWAAWRIGRLRAALPGLAEALLDRVDADLESVPPLDELSSRQLVALLHRGRDALRSLHAHEVLMGLLTDEGGNRLTAASVALRVLSEARLDGLSDDEIRARSPVVLALTGPRVGPPAPLPPEPVTPDLGDSTGEGSDAGVLREALRLRVRWLQELTGAAAWNLGRRLAAAGTIPAPEAVRHLDLTTVESLVTRRAAALGPVIASQRHRVADPLPACFRLSDLGEPITTCRADEVGGGTGAGGGTGRGPVTHNTVDPPVGSVLVTTVLVPGLGPLLGRLAGIVAETGSVLSHLAILARERGVPIVVGYTGATEVFTDGTVVEVDGRTGDVTILEDPGGDGTVVEVDGPTGDVAGGGADRDGDCTVAAVDDPTGVGGGAPSGTPGDLDR